MSIKAKDKQDKLPNYHDWLLTLTSRDDSRPVLMGVYVTGNGEAVAADGFMLGIAPYKGKPGLRDRDGVGIDGDFPDYRQVIPHDYRYGFMLGIAPYKGKPGLRDRDGVEIDGDFPDYRQVIPHDYRYGFMVDSWELAAALMRASVIAREADNTVRLIFRPCSGVLLVRAESSETGAIEVVVTMQKATDDSNYAMAVDATLLLKLLAAWVKPHKGTVTQRKHRWHVKPISGTMQAAPDYDVGHTWILCNGRDKLLAVTPVLKAEDERAPSLAQYDPSTTPTAYKPRLLGVLMPKHISRDDEDYSPIVRPERPMLERPSAEWRAVKRPLVGVVLPDLSRPALPGPRTVALLPAPRQNVRLEHKGTWLWITFPAKPDEDVRAYLKHCGFRWSARRAQWYKPSADPGLYDAVHQYLARRSV